MNRRFARIAIVCGSFPVLSGRTFIVARFRLIDLGAIVDI